MTGRVSVKGACTRASPGPTPPQPAERRQLDAYRQPAAKSRQEPPPWGMRLAS